MQEEYYVRELKRLNAQINNDSNRLKEVQKQISEHNDALAKVKREIKKFDVFVNKKKHKSNMLEFGTPIKALLGLKKNFDKELTGAGYRNARGDLDKLVSEINRSRNNLLMEQDNLKSNINRYGAQLSKTDREYKEYKLNKEENQ